MYLIIYLPQHHAIHIHNPSKTHNHAKRTKRNIPLIETKHVHVTSLTTSQPQLLLLQTESEQLQTPTPTTVIQHLADSVTYLTPRPWWCPPPSRTDGLWLYSLVAAARSLATSLATIRIPKRDSHHTSRKKPLIPHHEHMCRRAGIQTCTQHPDRTSSMPRIFATIGTRGCRSYMVEPG